MINEKYLNTVVAEYCLTQKRSTAIFSVCSTPNLETLEGTTPALGSFVMSNFHIIFQQAYARIYHCRGYLSISYTMLLLGDNRSVFIRDGKGWRDKSPVDNIPSFYKHPDVCSR
jgi:hypothetical protein